MTWKSPAVPVIDASAWSRLAISVARAPVVALKVVLRRPTRSTVTTSFGLPTICGPNSGRPPLACDGHASTKICSQLVGSSSGAAMAGRPATSERLTNTTVVRTTDNVRGIRSLRGDLGGTIGTKPEFAAKEAVSRGGAQRSRTAAKFDDYEFEPRADLKRQRVAPYGLAVATPNATFGVIS